MLTDNFGQGGRRLRHDLQRISVTNQVEHLLTISLGSGRPSCVRRGHCQLLLLHVKTSFSISSSNEVRRRPEFQYAKKTILRSADFALSESCAQSKFLRQDPQNSYC